VSPPTPVSKGCTQTGPNLKWNGLLNSSAAVRANLSVLLSRIRKKSTRQYRTYASTATATSGRSGSTTTLSGVAIRKIGARKAGRWCAHAMAGKSRGWYGRRSLIRHRRSQQSCGKQRAAIKDLFACAYRSFPRPRIGLWHFNFLRA